MSINSNFQSSSVDLLSVVDALKTNLFLGSPDYFDSPRGNMTILGKRRCVIADDVRSSRELIRTWLEPMGYDCVTACDGHLAWEEILAQVPDLVVSDIEMPRFSGLELLQLARNHRSDEVRRMPIIVVSGLVDDELSHYVSLFGGTWLLSKPLDREATCAVVNRIEAGDLPERPSGVPQVQVDVGCRIVSPRLRRLVAELQHRHFDSA